jgi:hypothetical protein
MAKLPLTPEQAEWFDQAKIQKPEWVNPMVRKFGVDLEGRKYKGCDFIVANQCSKRYYKCKLRGVTSGPGTDHRLSWPACAKWTPFKPASKPASCGATSSTSHSPSAPAFSRAD